MIRPLVPAWRKHLKQREIASATIRRKVSATSALVEYLCENNAIERNPTHGVKRPGEGSTPSLADAQATALLTAPPEETLKDLRDRAILATYLSLGLRAAERANLPPGDIQNRGAYPTSEFSESARKPAMPPPIPPPSASSRNTWNRRDTGHREERG